MNPVGKIYELKTRVREGHEHKDVGNKGDQARNLRDDATHLVTGTTSKQFNFAIERTVFIVAKRTDG